MYGNKGLGVSSPDRVPRQSLFSSAKLDDRVLRRGIKKAQPPLGCALLNHLFLLYADFRCAMLAKNSCARRPTSCSVSSSLCVAMPQL